MKIPRDTILTVVLLTTDDENIIGKSLLELNKTLRTFKTHYEIIAVDNFSTDKTVEEIKNVQKKYPHTRTLRLSKRYTDEVALTVGLDNAIGDYTIIYNPHISPVDMIGKIFEKLLQNYDLVLCKSKKGVYKRSVLSKFLIRLAEKSSKNGFTYNDDFLMGFSRRAVNSLIKIRRKNRNFGYLNSLIGFNKIYLEYTPRSSYIKKAKNERILDVLTNIFNIIISNSFKPIRILSFLGMLFSIIFLAYIFAIVLLDIVLKTSFAPKGWISVSTVLGSMFFLLFSLLTIISEYLIRILSESRDEPLYYVAEEIDKSVLMVDRKKSLNVV